MITVVDKKYRYVSVFDPETGLSVRSNIYDVEGKDTGIEPFRGSFPELLDIGIMGYCVHGKKGLCLLSGVECYQDGFNITEKNMSLERFKRIIDQASGRTFQIALGGRGDPDMHEDIVEILYYARSKNVIPNFTTSGYGLKKELLPVIKECCGAVAVSWYRSDYTLKAIKINSDC